MEQVDQAIEKRRRQDRERWARKQAAKPDRRKVLGQWIGLTTEAFNALKEMDRLDKLAGTLLFIFSAILANAQVPVIADTNQLSKLPSGIKLEWRTNLYEAETLTFVTTNWMPVGPPVDIVTNGVVIVRRQVESATLLTNVVHRLVHAGVERRFIVSQTTGPVLATRTYDIPPKLESPPFLAVPTRKQR